ncbi:MAG TPA: chaperone modulator CbpM [Saprospiraceae bacterium]|nr:chaperone modulator CbpM [Saprospiraceae bacterium]
MDTLHLISKEQFCIYNKVEVSFIDSLHDMGLIDIVVEKEEQFIPDEQLKNIEVYTHFHYELAINLEGIDAISHLLQRVNALQENLSRMRNRLMIYEEG